MKSVWPKLGIEAGTGKHGTESIPDGLVSSLDRTILMRAIGTSRTDIVAVTLE
jgi:hypothetical protein